MKIKIILFFGFFLSLYTTAFAQDWKVYTGRVYCNKCGKENIGEAAFWIDSDERYALEIYFSTCDSNRHISKTYSWGYFTGEKMKDCFVLNDIPCGSSIYLKRNMKNNWVIKNAPGFIENLEFFVVSSFCYQSNGFENLFEKDYVSSQLNKVILKSGGEVYKDFTGGIFADSEGFILNLSSNGRFVLYMGQDYKYHKDGCPIAKGKWSRNNNGLVLSDKNYPKNINASFISADSLICTNIPGGVSIFLRKK